MPKSTKKNIRRTLFIASVSLFVLTLAFLLVYDLNDKQLLVAILALISLFLTAIGFGHSLKKYKR